MRVHPALVPVDHPLAGVRGAFNAVFVEAEAAGELMFYGRGAGGEPTASAVLGDVVSVARHRVLGGKGPGRVALRGRCPCCPPRPPAPATRCASRSPTARACSRRSPPSWRRTTSRSRPCASRPVAETPDADVARLVITTHAAPERALRSTVDAIAGLDVVRRVVSVLRVEGA